MARTVLIVDDDPEFRALASMLVGAWGFTIAAAVATGEDALAAARSSRPDVALVDVGLPDGDGLLLAQRLLALHPAPDVVLISSDSRAASEPSVRRAGAIGFIAKDQLTGDRIRQLLQGGSDD